MPKSKVVNSSQDTAYASQATYEVENMRVNDDVDPNKNKTSTNNILHDKQSLPSNLEYVDSFRDASTGTSGTAFKDKNTDEIIIAYTGTNLNADPVQDVKTDAVDILVGTGSHYEAAYQFYDKMAKKYGSDTITLTGHSLGGNVAQRVALKKNAQSTVVYNAAPLYVPLVTQAMKANPALTLLVTLSTTDNINDIKQDRKTFTGKVIRIRTEGDPLNAAANRAGAVYLGEEIILDDSGGHKMGDIVADPEQMKQIQVILSEQASVKRVQATLKAVDSQMKSVKTMEKKYASGGLTGSEQIFLDAEQAAAVSQGLTSVSQEAVIQVASEEVKALKKAKDTYDKLNDVPFGMILTPDEVKEAYAEAGCTYDSIVGNVERHCSKTKQKFQDLADDFSELEGQIANAITTMVQTDSEIAGMINEG
ncbi:lipase [Streptococcus criceti]|uniref:Fungal lipase-like domain-containing protein n=1 Tax=Streptococcus criceti HS-6 TaxID=873449 RepID=G5JMT6_STRCG|nr:DUF6792 domain-containing protein [Streptococcus criceti]EHI73731.1 hypothetical protein STRCR_0051 [Streptococcus criceti HS-6]SUN41566.1 lipase [Streptococcus criceti]